LGGRRLTFYNIESSGHSFRERRRRRRKIVQSSIPFCAAISLHFTLSGGIHVGSFQSIFFNQEEHLSRDTHNFSLLFVASLNNLILIALFVLVYLPARERPLKRPSQNDFRRKCLTGFFSTHSRSLIICLLTENFVNFPQIFLRLLPSEEISLSSVVDDEVAASLSGLRRLILNIMKISHQLTTPSLAIFSSNH
jgi:hypothetical protein